MEKTNLSSSWKDNEKSIRKKRAVDESVGGHKKEWWIFYCSACVCFVEEVILADDENENDYDGIYAHCIY